MDHGLEQILVSDDGIGIRSEDLPLIGIFFIKYIAHIPPRYFIPTIFPSPPLIHVCLDAL